MTEFKLSMINWMNCIWQTDLPSNSKLIAAYLRSHMNDHHDVAWPSLSTIQGKTGLSRATVVKYIDELCYHGWLIRDRETRKSTTYIAIFPKIIEEKVQKLNSLGDELAGKTSLGGEPDSLTPKPHSSPDELALVHQLNTNKQVNKQSNKQGINKYKNIDFSVLGFTDDQVNEFIRIRKANAKKKDITQRVVNSLAKEFHEAATKGYTFDELLDEWEIRGWQALKSDWIKPKAQNAPQHSDVTLQNMKNFAQVELK